MHVPQVGFGAGHGSPDGHSHIHLTDASPVQQSAAQTIVGVSPKPGVVDVGVPMAQRHIVAVGGELAGDRGLVLRDSRHVFAEPCHELC